jgi:hypothetical protein
LKPSPGASIESIEPQSRQSKKARKDEESMLFWVTGDFNGSLQTEAKEMVNSRYLAMIEAAFYIQKWQPFAKPHQCVEPLNQGEKIQTTLFFERL